MDPIGNRYMLDQPIKRLKNERLLRGMDLTLNRKVLLYTFKESDDSVFQESLRWLSKASQLSDEHFMHIADTGSEDGVLFAVFQAEPGTPLSDQLNDLEVSGREALTYIYELAKGIRESRRFRLPECSVDVDNLWLEENGRLRIMNCWTEGKNGRRGVPGLALLLYQLSARTNVPTSSIRAYSDELNRLFADLPDEIRERAMALACKAYEGICTLADFQQQLEVLLGKGDSKEPILVSAPPSYDRFPKSLHPYKWPLLAAASLGSLVLLLWLTQRPHPHSVSGSMPQMAATPNPTAVSTNRTEKPMPSASAPLAIPAPTASPASDRPMKTEVRTADDAAVQSKASVVPDLIAHTREEAEKLVLASGLRYSFILESNAAAKGTVFKQEPAPGTAVTKGDRITFWVSKGK